MSCLYSVYVCLHQFECTCVYLCFCSLILAPFLHLHVFTCVLMCLLFLSFCVIDFFHFFQLLILFISLLFSLFLPRMCFLCVYLCAHPPSPLGRRWRVATPPRTGHPQFQRGGNNVTAPGGDVSVTSWLCVWRQSAVIPRLVWSCVFRKLAKITKDNKKDMRFFPIMGHSDITLRQSGGR